MYLQKFCVKYEGRILLQNKGIILYFILELSRVEYELDNSGSVCVMSEGTTVPVRATQMLYLNLKSAAAHYYRQCCIDPSEHCAVSV